MKSTYRTSIAVAPAMTKNACRENLTRMFAPDMPYIISFSYVRITREENQSSSIVAPVA
jgi:hypothetical protein